MRWLPWLVSAVLLAGLARAQTTPPRAMWLWDPAPLLDDAAARRDFFASASATGSVSSGPRSPHGSSGDPRHLDRASDWKALVAETHRRGMKVHALDGDPHYALRDQHAVPLSIVNAVVAYNAAAAANERFDGIHFDNEPYLLLEWRDPRLREQLLEDYLDLNSRAAAAARDAGLAYGVDIPFWWASLDDATGEATGIVTFRGTRQAAWYHLLAIVDNLGIMDYRTTAAGPDGIVAHATDTLQRAERVTGARIYVGVETSIQSGDRPFLLGVPREAIRAAIVSRASSASLLDRHRARLIDDGAAVHVGVKVSATADEALGEIARAFRVPAGASSDAAAASAQAAFRSEGEWLDVRPRSIGAGDTTFAGVSATLMTPPKVTFAGKSLSEMNRQLAEAETAFSEYRSYAGIAIHDYAAFSRLAGAAR